MTEREPIRIEVGRKTITVYGPDHEDDTTIEVETEDGDTRVYLNPTQVRQLISELEAASGASVPHPQESELHGRVKLWMDGYHSSVNGRGWQNQPAIPSNLMADIEMYFLSKRAGGASLPERQEP